MLMHDDHARTPKGPQELSLIGRRLRSLRKTNNLSQREVADAIGLPQSNLSRIENGKQRLNLTVLARMLSIYEMSIQDFFSHEEALEAAEAAEASGAGDAKEQQLLEAYRRLGDGDRTDVDAYVDFKLFQARKERMAREDDVPDY
jgi:transcriptional regulator with XRE-family HTH domain